MEEKCEKNAKIEYFWAKTCRVYRYRLSCTSTGMLWATGIGIVQTCTGTNWQWVTYTGTGQSCTGTGCSSNPIFSYFALLSPVFIHRLFGDPKK